MVVLSASKFVISLEDVYPAGKYVVKYQVNNSHLE